MLPINTYSKQTQDELDLSTIIARELLFLSDRKSKEKICMGLEDLTSTNLP